MIKVGVVGLGAMGQHHVRLYSQLGCNLVGVADASPERAKQIGTKYDIPYYSDYRELLTQVEAVSIAVPTSLHSAVAMDFLERGIHCLVEKPIASRLDEADQMIYAAERNQATLAVGHIEQFNPAVTKLKNILDDGVLGRPLIISTRRVGPFVSRIRDVGVVIDSAVHDIGVVRYLVGKEPISVFSRVGSIKHPKDDHAIIVLDFGGTTASIEVNWFTPLKVRTLVVTGSEGIAYLDYIEQKLTVYDSHGGLVPFIPKEEPLKLELQDFLRSLEGGSKPGVDGKDGLAILRISLESSQSSHYVPPALEKSSVQ